MARASFEAFSSGRIDDYVAGFTEDVVWEVSAFLTGKDSYQGREGVREFIDDVSKLEEEHDERFQVSITGFRELDDGRVLGLGMARIIRRDPLEFETGVLYAFAGDKISRLDVFTSRAEALAAAGLA